MAVDLTLSVQDPTKVLGAFEALAGKQIEIQVMDADYNANWSFSFDSKGAETNKQFGERVAKQILRAFVRVVDYAEDRERYNTEVGAVTPPAQDVNDNVIT